MLTKKERIKYSGLFKQAYQKGQTLRSKNFKISYTQTLERCKDDLPLVGFSISKQFSKSAVKRNRAKRQVREIYRLYRLNAKNVEKLKDIGLLVISMRGDWGKFPRNFSILKKELEALLLQL